MSAQINMIRKAIMIRQEMITTEESLKLPNDFTETETNDEVNGSGENLPNTNQILKIGRS